MINFAVFGVIFLLKIARNSRSLWLRVLGAVFCLAGFVLLVIKSRIIPRFVYNGRIVALPTWRYWDLLISNKFQHWFSLLPELGYLILLIVTFFALRAIFQKGRKREEMISFSFLIFLALLLFLTFFLVTPRIPARVRYGVLLEYWYVLIASLGIFVILRILTSLLKKSKVAQIGAIILVGFMCINVNSIYQVLDYRGGGVMRVTGEKHYLIGSAYQFMQPLLKDGDVLLTDYLGSYDELYKKEFLKVKMFSFLKTIIRGDTSWTSLVDKYQEGWIVLTSNSRIEVNGPPFENSEVDQKMVYYLGRWGECYIWHWIDRQ